MANKKVLTIRNIADSNLISRLGNITLGSSNKKLSWH